ncbi:hypothetical protein LIA77_08532 [Sarocladium implicatum]|nr:hypothetical protein LIA77_08532 [Sarocladium implicatum]
MSSVGGLRLGRSGRAGAGAGAGADWVRRTYQKSDDEKRRGSFRPALRYLHKCHGCTMGRSISGLAQYLSWQWSQVLAAVPTATGNLLQCLEPLKSICWSTTSSSTSRTSPLAGPCGGAGCRSASHLRLLPLGPSLAIARNNDRPGTVSILRSSPDSLSTCPPCSDSRTV